MSARDSYRRRPAKQRIDQYHSAVQRHMRERAGAYSPVWFQQLGKILDAWGAESREVARHRGCLPWQVRLFRAAFVAWVGIMLTIILSGGW